MKTKAEVQTEAQELVDLLGSQWEPKVWQTIGWRGKWRGDAILHLESDPNNARRYIIVSHSNGVYYVDARLPKAYCAQTTDSKAAMAFDLRHDLELPSHPLRAVRQALIMARMEAQTMMRTVDAFSELLREESMP